MIKYDVYSCLEHAKQSGDASPALVKAAKPFGIDGVLAREVKGIWYPATAHDKDARFMYVIPTRRKK